MLTESAPNLPGPRHWLCRCECLHKQKTVARWDLGKQTQNSSDHPQRHFSTDRELRDVELGKAQAGVCELSPLCSRSKC